MNYIYPKLSDKDLNFMRLGGAGLGNILFTYARAFVFSKKSGIPLIWPTWFSFKLGTILRNEQDKRFYNDLFKNNSGYIDGLKKAWFRLTKSKVAEKDRNNYKNFDNKIIEFTGFDGCFEEILYDSKIIYEDLVKNLMEKNKKPLDYDFTSSISFHIRLGDFNRAVIDDVRNGLHNSSLPIMWYVSMLEQIRGALGYEIKAYIFSDGTEQELNPILSLPNVERITFGTSIADILALSKAKLLVASGSSFSMWARYLGRMNTICFENQIKQRILTEKDDTFEIEVNDIIATEYLEKIKFCFKGLS